MTTAKFIRGKSTVYRGHSYIEGLSVNDAILECQKQFPNLYCDYDILIFYCEGSEALDKSALNSDLYRKLKTTPEKPSYVWYREGNLWISGLGERLDAITGLSVAESSKSAVRRKSIPALPVEVWNPRMVDPVAAWKAVQDLCKGN